VRTTKSARGALITRHAPARSKERAPALSLKQQQGARVLSLSDRYTRQGLHFLTHLSLVGTAS